LTAEERVVAFAAFLPFPLMKERGARPKGASRLKAGRNASPDVGSCPWPHDRYRYPAEPGYHLSPSKQKKTPATLGRE